MINDLRNLHWLDLYTKALTVDFNLFTPSKDLLSSICLIFEWTPEGIISPSLLHLHTTKLLLYSNDNESYIFFAEVWFSIRMKLLLLVFNSRLVFIFHVLNRCFLNISVKFYFRIITFMNTLNMLCILLYI